MPELIRYKELRIFFYYVSHMELVFQHNQHPLLNEIVVHQSMQKKMLNPNLKIVLCKSL